MGGAQAQRIGRMVKNRREAKGWRPEDLAHEAQIGIRTVVRIEAGQTDRMRLDTARKLASSLDLKIEELRPPEPEDESETQAQLREVLSRLQRIELAVGVEPPADQPADSEELELDEELAAQQSESTGLPSEEPGHEAVSG